MGDYWIRPESQPDWNRDYGIWNYHDARANWGRTIADPAVAFSAPSATPEGLVMLAYRESDSPTAAGVMYTRLIHMVGGQPVLGDELIHLGDNARIGSAVKPALASDGLDFYCAFIDLHRRDNEGVP